MGIAEKTVGTPKILGHHTKNRRHCCTSSNLGAAQRLPDYPKRWRGMAITALVKLLILSFDVEASRSSSRGRETAPEIHMKSKLKGTKIIDLTQVYTIDQLNAADVQPEGGQQIIVIIFSRSSSSSSETILTSMGEQIIVAADAWCYSRPTSGSGRALEPPGAGWRRTRYSHEHGDSRSSSRSLTRSRMGTADHRRSVYKRMGTGNPRRSVGPEGI